MNLLTIPTKDIFSDSDFNCRGPITPFDVETLAQSLKEKGLLQPIVVQNYKTPPYRYKIVVGHRRFAAANRLKWTEISANLAENITEDEARTLNLIENLERQDLNMLQEANAIRWYRERGLQLKEVADKVGKSTGWVSTRYIVLDLDPDIQTEIAAGLLKQDQIKALYAINSRQGRVDAVKRIKEAKERGEGEEIILAKPKKSILLDVTTKKTRDMRELFELQDAVHEAIGPNIITRTLAWASGIISLKDLDKDIQAFAITQGKVFQLPTTVKV